MKELPAALNGDDVRAVLAGVKTQVRRPIRPQPQGHHWERIPGHKHFAYVEDGGAVWTFGHSIPQNPSPDMEWIRCPYGAAGDALWVRETWSPDHRNVYPCFPVVYRADRTVDEPLRCVCPRGWDTEAEKGHHFECLMGARSDNPFGPTSFRWRSPIAMPRRLSRLVLRVTRVRAERLHAITEEDALAEGIVDTPDRVGAHLGVYGGAPSHRTAYGAFAARWSEVHGRASWDANPWVWVADFVKREVLKT